MNSVDNSRLNDKLAGAVIVNLDDYRNRAAIASPKTVKPYLDPVRLTMATWGIVIAFVLFALFARR